MGTRELGLQTLWAELRQTPRVSVFAHDGSIEFITGLVT